MGRSRCSPRLQRINPDAEFVLWGAEDGAQANIHSADESVDLAELERAALAQRCSLHRLGPVLTWSGTAPQ